ncbi:MAG TPA: hypothetical protein VHZ55_07790, partial [Bryobacteraceae bacterium]|nr:hypothetical protein [Bryobacteraceae bacterium]
LASATTEAAIRTSNRLIICKILIRLRSEERCGDKLNNIALVGAGASLCASPILSSSLPHQVIASQYCASRKKI